MPDWLGKSPGDPGVVSTFRRPSERVSQRSNISSDHEEQNFKQPVMQMSAAVRQRPGFTPARAMPPRLTPGPVFPLTKLMRNDLAPDGFAS
jgi:hypothetical protein